MLLIVAAVSDRRINRTILGRLPLTKGATVGDRRYKQDQYKRKPHGPETVRHLAPTPATAP